MADSASALREEWQQVYADALEIARDLVFSAQGISADALVGPLAAQLFVMLTSTNGVMPSGQPNGDPR